MKITRLKARLGYFKTLFQFLKDAKLPKIIFSYFLALTMDFNNYALAMIYVSTPSFLTFTTGICVNGKNVL